ncbi:cysteine hydrolase [Arthrobacter sp. MYb227]|uniref:isochorismatase family protein n=1 Tax=Arthrobacter sp. MYb227 TaxID=1848601 RepID=UPI000CFB5E39|nr:isochorismatase family protein [Arthrobacter sp. MYb227]PQZ92390.1 cysteine hydrolase [Arthrobacter sp. MYb227]
MSTLENRIATALVVIDMQNAVITDAQNVESVTKNISLLVESARESKTPVIWVQHSDEELVFGSNEWEFVQSLRPLETEPLIAKNHGDSFEATELETVLAAAGVGHLAISGAESDACVRSTIHGAFTRGYDVILVSDAHTCTDRTAWGAPEPASVIAHMNLYWQFQSAPGRTATVSKTAEVVFGSRRS